ncbi:MAG: cyclodeaminase/cyclohydrolase family protein [Clostridiales bacterium]
MSFTEKTCNELISELASKASVPGGGGASALVGAVGTALGNMVGSFTKGKKKFANVEDEIVALQAKCDALQDKFLQLMDDDAELFFPLSQAYAMKETTEDERREKEKVMKTATLNACKVPMEIMESCCQAVEILEEFYKIGNPLLLSDVGVGAICCHSALLGAGLNVYINTKTMMNREIADDINEKTEIMISVYGKRAVTLYDNVKRSLQ